jgi:hypothetical protein
VRYLLDPEALFLSTPASPALEAFNTLNFVSLILFLGPLVVRFTVLPPGLSLYAFGILLLPVLTSAPSFSLVSLHACC